MPATQALTDVPQRGDARGLRVPHRAAAVPAARREFLSDVCARLDANVSHEAAVVLSELLGNAVRHADSVDGDVLVRWQVRGGTVDVEVTDGGARAQVRPLRPATYATSGRGLRIVRSIAHEWGVVEDGQGHRTVWAAVGGPSRRRRRT
ncbi:ATP-binding protein [Thalassiella azotivora]